MMCVYDLHKIGDGVCDDPISRMKSCFNDYGDCCLTVLNTTRCTECICDYTGKYQGITIEEMFQSLQDQQDYWTHVINEHPKGRVNTNPHPQLVLISC